MSYISDPRFVFWIPPYMFGGLLGFIILVITETFEHFSKTFCVIIVGKFFAFHTTQSGVGNPKVVELESLN